jgi:hypothetical protein
VTAKTGAIKIVSKTTRCRAGQHKISRNNIGARGPAGPRGAKGVTGTRGPRGRQGPPGVVTGYQSFSQPDTALSTHLMAVATLTLPAGAFLVNATMTVLGGSTADNIECALTDAVAHTLDDEGSGAAANSAAFLALTGVTASGGTETVSCLDDHSNSTLTSVSVTAIRVASAVAKPAHPRRRHDLPRGPLRRRPHAAPPLDAAPDLVRAPWHALTRPHAHSDKARTAATRRAMATSLHGPSARTTGASAGGRYLRTNTHRHTEDPFCAKATGPPDRTHRAPDRAVGARHARPS